MVTHFFYDITHFDTSFFHTIHHLVLKPGFLSKEYVSGKRMKYLHPIRMYVFTSAMFFLIFFSFFSPKTEITDTKKPLDAAQRASFIDSLEKKIKTDTGNLVLKNKLKLVKDSVYNPTIKDVIELENRGNFIKTGKNNYKDFEEYDSVQKAKPAEERDGWLMRRIMKKIIAINIKYRDEPEEAFKKLGESILHRLPYLLFVSLPLFAGILKLVYIRRKQFYYSDHGVFTIHHYVFSFLILLLVFCLTAVQTATGWGIINYIYAVLFIWLFSYLYFGMKRFYGQGWGKTFFKFLLVAFISLVMMIILMAFFTLFSAITL